MSKIESAYIRSFNNEGGICYLPLKPTGRWKIESGPYYEDKMFVEHQGLFFRRWIDDICIDFKPELQSQTFVCTRQPV